MHDDDPAVRALAVDVLGALADRDPRALPLLLAVAGTAAQDPDDDVRWAVADALDHGDDPRVVPVLLRLTHDADHDVRWKAVTALPLLLQDPASDDPGVQALLRACADEDPDVRDWAAFGLGVLLDVDTPAVRDALATLLEDAEADTAGEAAVGLARRRDPRVLAVLLRELATPDVGNLYVEAAGELGDPALLPALLALQAAGWQTDHEPRPGVLDEALRSCRGPG